MLPKSKRLTRKQFDRVFSGGKVNNLNLFRVKYIPADDFRLAVVVSRKTLRGAVARIRLRRKVYGALQSPITGSPSGWYILFAKPSILQADHIEIEKELKKIIS